LRFFNEENNYEKRIRVFKKLLNEQNIDYLEFFADGDIPLTKVFSLIYLGDMISFYLAILNQTNPTTINFINYLKQNI
ncbi:MAG TPA: SIS domain-containing protein, partial [Candidatus Cloacimonadota bacterium]|nr:SIS domain-containing protein [Candidatus Cloacimonadota bacterium]